MYYYLIICTVIKLEKLLLFSGSSSVNDRTALLLVESVLTEILQYTTVWGWLEQL